MVGWVFAVLLLLVPGLIAAVGAVVAFVAGDTAGEVNREFEGDDDGDGRTDEDPFGDADTSNGDPTQVTGVAEAQNHADDDSDGRVDEDPPPQGALDQTETVAKGTGMALLGVAVILLAAFGVVAWLLVRSDRAAHRLA